MKIEQNKLTEARKPTFDMAEIRRGQKLANELVIKFGEAEGRRLSFKEKRFSNV